MGGGPADAGRGVPDPADGVPDVAAEVGAELYDALQGQAVVGAQRGEGRPLTPSVPASEASAAVAARCWASVTRPPPAVQTTIAGTVPFLLNAVRSVTALVDSALRGRKAAWSLVETSPSLPAYGPRVPPMPSQATSSTTGSSHRTARGRDVIALSRGVRNRGISP